MKDDIFKKFQDFVIASFLISSKLYGNKKECQTTPYFQRLQNSTSPAQKAEREKSSIII
jgi:hypothetical protein